MKKTKKIFALLLALIMAMAMSVTALAATITINGNSGETYTAYKVLDVSTSTDDEGKVTGYSYTTSKSAVADVLEDVGATVTESKAGNLWYVTWDAEDADTLTTYLAGLNDEALTALLGEDSGSVTLDGETGNITGLAAGYYFVTSTTGSLCMLNTAADTVPIYEKNEAPVPEKTVSDANAQIGDTVTYTVTITVPAETESLELNDTLSKGLTLATDSFTVQVDESEPVVLNSVETTTGEDESTSFSLDLTDYMIEGDCTITVTYEATINENAIHTDPATNSATVSYGNNSTSNATTTETNTHLLTIVKEDNEGNRLDGAEFQLSDTDSNLIYVIGNATKGYRVATADEIENAETSGATTTIIVNGSVTVDGLDAETYTLTETKAPEGYNLLTTPESITVTVDNTATITVENQAGSILPSTGGMGTTVIYIAGIVLVLGAGVTLIVRRRMRAGR